MIAKNSLELDQGSSRDLCGLIITGGKISDGRGVMSFDDVSSFADLLDSP